MGDGEKDTTKLTHSLIPKDIGQFVQQQEHECSILTCIRDGTEERSRGVEEEKGRG